MHYHWTYKYILLLCKLQTLKSKKSQTIVKLFWICKIEFAYNSFVEKSRHYAKFLLLPIYAYYKYINISLLC